MNDEMEMIYKKAALTYSGYNPGVWLEELKKIVKTLSEHTWDPGKY